MQAHSNRWEVATAPGDAEFTKDSTCTHSQGLMQILFGVHHSWGHVCTPACTIT